MSKGQKIYFIIAVSLYLAILLWLFIEKEYSEIIKSITILIGSAILGIIFAKLGDNNDN